MKYNAFVIMPFDSSFNDVYNLGIKAAANECNVDAKRLDDDFFVTNMVEEIYKKINKADFIIADMTGRNPNVFYEVGYADAKNKLILLLTKNISDIPFDFKQKLHIEYKDVSSLRDNLINKIDWAKREIDKRKKNKIDISLNVGLAYFDRTEYLDTANVKITLEITNLSNEPIDNLQMIDITTGVNWDFYINDKNIKSEYLNEKNYRIARHRFIPEEKIIPAHDHIQIILTGKKIMWSSWNGETRKDEYILMGMINIKVHLNNMIFEEKKVIKETAIHENDGIPF